VSVESAEYGHYADDEGELHYRYCAALRLSHPSADPSSWSEETGLTPDLVERAGEPRIRGKHRKQYGVAKCSFFVHDLPASTQPCAFEDFLASVLAKFEGLPVFLDHLVADGGDAELFIGFFMEREGTGFFLPPELQRRLGELHLALNLHLYNFKANPAAAAPQDDPNP
jgi:hypothetical protein